MFGENDETSNKNLSKINTWISTEKFSNIATVICSCKKKERIKTPKTEEKKINLSVYIKDWFN